MKTTFHWWDFSSRPKDNIEMIIGFEPPTLYVVSNLLMCLGTKIFDDLTIRKICHKNKNSNKLD